MAFTLLGSTSIPFWLTIKPSSFPDLTPKVHLEGIQSQLVLMQSFEQLSQVDEMFLLIFRLGNHVIHVNLNFFVHHIME